MRAILEHVGRQPYSERFYLAGGTALALRIGHRRSVDLDFFSATDELLEGSRHEIRVSMEPYGAVAVEDTTGNLLLETEGLYVAFLSYGYPLLGPAATAAGIAVASPLDIGLMKLDALIRRGSRKDFYDLYFILQEESVEELLAHGRSKYEHARDFEVMAVTSLVAFDNADDDRQPEMLVDVSWPEVKRFFEQQARRIGGTWM